MTLSSSPALQALLDDPTLDGAQLCRLVGVEADWLHQRVADGLVNACAAGEGGVVRFDAVPELAALVADLEEELRTLRAQLQRARP